MQVGWILSTLLLKSGDNLKLTERLLKIAQLAKGSQKLIDVGCDHAKLPIYLIENGLAQSVIGEIKKWRK